jgi:hypothetical protein
MFDHSRLGVSIPCRRQRGFAALLTIRHRSELRAHNHQWPRTRAKRACAGFVA